MKTLIIHPDDRSTDFLCPIYSKIKGATVLRNNVSPAHLVNEIRRHDQILMMGHGSPYGLLNCAQIGKGSFSIEKKHASLLKKKRCIFIWCNADEFVKQHQLRGIYTGMFISEVKESLCCKVHAEQEEVDASNSNFAEIFGELLTAEVPNYSHIFENIKIAYGELAILNEVADYKRRLESAESTFKMQKVRIVYFYFTRFFSRMLFTEDIFVCYTYRKYWLKKSSLYGREWQLWVAS